MNPSDFIPTAGAVSVHWGWFKLLLMPVFTAHILLMNIMLGASIIALFSPRKSGDNGTPLLQKALAERLPGLIAITACLGVGALFFLQVLYGRFAYVGSWRMAVFWLSVFGLVGIAYSIARLQRAGFEQWRPFRSLLLGTAILLFLLVAFLLTNNMTLMLHPERWPLHLSRSGGSVLNLSDPTLIPRYLHFVTASVAIGGLCIAATWERKKAKGEAPRGEADAMIETGMGWFAYATLFQLAVGAWFQFSLPGEIMALFLGGSVLHTVVLAAGLLLVVQSLIYGFQRRVWPTVFSTAFLVIDMVILRDLVRAAYLKPYFGAAELAAGGGFTLFVVSVIGLVAVVGTILRVVKSARNAGGRNEGDPLDMN